MRGINFFAPLIQVIQISIQVLNYWKCISINRWFTILELAIAGKSYRQYREYWQYRLILCDVYLYQIKYSGISRSYKICVIYISINWYISNFSPSISQFPYPCSLCVQMVMLKSADGADSDWSREVKGNMYDIVVEGFQLLSRWTGRVWEQCAWKFSRPCKDPASFDSFESSTTFFDYEKVCFLIFFSLLRLSDCLSLMLFH